MTEGTAPFFALRGVVEGFYGSFYTFPERRDLIRFLGRNGFNFYLYGPKNDRQHRMRWWDPYPDYVLEAFAETIELARKVGVRFCYAISFGVPMTYASDEDFRIITDKFEAFYDRGCRDFGVLLDDITDGFVHEVNQKSFPSVAHAHATTCNHLYQWAQSLPDPCRLYMCPSEYYGRAPFSSYLHDLGRDLDPAIAVFYTGPSISSRTITPEDVRGFADTVRRRPVIWDNYPVNDLGTRSQLHVGPLQGRSSDLYQGCAGWVANVMLQEEAGKIPLRTIGAYLRDPARYEPEAAWTVALRRAAGDDSYTALRHFAENSLASPLQDEQAPTMTRLSSLALDELKRGERVSESAAVGDLRAYLDVIDESCYHLKNRMGNVPLRQNLLPWVEALEDKLWMGRRALTVMQAVEDGPAPVEMLSGLDDLQRRVEHTPYSVGGGEILSLARWVRRRARNTVGREPLPRASSPPTTAELDSAASPGIRQTAASGSDAQGGEHHGGEGT